MKIHKQGLPKKEIERRKRIIFFSCKICGCVFEIDPAIDKDYDYACYGAARLRANCPNCNGFALDDDELKWQYFDSVDAEEGHS